MIAALAAARSGGAVALLEKNNDLGRKLLLTGNGRCNLTNQTDCETLVANTPGNGRFLYSAFSRLAPADLRRLLLSYGLATRVERDGRVFPVEGDARQVLETLRRALKREGVEIRTGTAVEGLHLSANRVVGVRVGDSLLPARAVIIATGGLSYPATGSTGDGYRLAASAGHRIVPASASLVPLEGAAPWMAGLQGVSLRGVHASLRGGRATLDSYRGDLVFTHYGVSGPLILRLSRAAVRHLLIGARPDLVLDLQPGTETGDLSGMIRDVLAQKARRLARGMLDGLVPGRLGANLVAYAGIAPDKPVHQVTTAEGEAVCRLLKHLPLAIIGARPIEEAQVTVGGVDVADVDPRAMASRLVYGLYFAGEVLDVDGYSGGFNLQIAFSTGFLAGEAAGSVS